MSNLQTSLKVTAIQTLAYKFDMNPQVIYTENKAIIYFSRQDAINLLKKLEQDKKESDIEIKANDFIIEILLRKFLSIIIILILIGFIIGKVL